MKAELVCDIPVYRVAAFAEMAWLERRPELGLVCRAAQVRERRLNADAVRDALPGLSDAGARNVIAWCRDLGLCDAQGVLTELGDDVADTDEAPVPEQGAYDLWLAAHPLLGRRLLAAARWGSRDQLRPRFEDIAPLPVVPPRGVVTRSALDPKERFVLRDLPTNHGQAGAIEQQTTSWCRLRWTLDFDRRVDSWTLEGELDAAPRATLSQGKSRKKDADPTRPIAAEAESARLDLDLVATMWGETVLADYGRWDPTDRRLAVAFDGLSDSEREAFSTSMELVAVSVPGVGRWRDVAVEGVPIGPRDGDDAQRWAMARFERALAAEPRYRTRADVRALFRELTEGTPLAPLGPRLPAHDALLGAPTDRETRERFWRLAAPVDLAPSQVSATELDELAVAA